MIYYMPANSIYLWFHKIYQNRVHQWFPDHRKWLNSHMQMKVVNLCFENDWICDCKWQFLCSSERFLVKEPWRQFLRHLMRCLAWRWHGIRWTLMKSSVHRTTCSDSTPRSTSSRTSTMIPSSDSTLLGLTSTVELSTSSPRCSPLAHFESNHTWP